MVRLRLTRMGRKKRPFYRVVAIDSRAPRDGRYLENLGTYNPLQEPFDVTLKEERILYWLGVGAKPSDTVRSILRREGVLYKWDLIKQGLSEEEMDEKMKLWEVIQMERQKKLQYILEEKKAKRAKQAKEKAEAAAAAEAEEEAAPAKAEKAESAAAEEKVVEAVTEEVEEKPEE